MEANHDQTLHIIQKTDDNSYDMAVHAVRGASGMNDTGGVISGLECCIKGLCDLCKYCNSDGPGGCRDELMLDAFLLLEAQLPRVMILEEVKALKQDAVVWYEHAGVHPPRPRVVHYANDEHIVFSDGGDFRYGADGYGKHFRLWTFCPTDSQRKETPWKD